MLKSIYPKAIAGGLVLLSLIGACRQSPEEPEGSAGRFGGMVAGSCVERYTAETLSAREYALDGIVTRIETQPQMGRPEGPDAPPVDGLGSDVTFEVRRWYKGGAGSTVALKTSVGVGEVTSVDFPALRVGERYLVSGDGGYIWGCGFSRGYSLEEAQVWAEAFSN